MKLARWLSRPSGFCVGGLSSVSLTADSSRCGGSLWGFCLQACPYPNAVKVAAALSAAVTTTKQQENAPISQAEPPMQKHAIQTPAALRERGVWGERRFSQRSGLSPQNLPYHSLPRSLPPCNLPFLWLQSWGVRGWKDRFGRCCGSSGGE